ncbi:FtsB family cell division protein [Defluviitalea phaphyphila]|uniref:FtsB family cell division protein n=1 Tax=Defluviitalea phaphyphila TaxID=1473580 RepID=UPI000A01D993|nr:septum formation initiator family protein [Defluviitalea phaphyphila]
MKKRNKKTFKIRWNAIFILIFLLMIAFKSYDLQKINKELEAQKKEYSKQIEMAKEEQESLLEEKEYSQSKEYIEKVAREKLGLIKEDEIIFMEKN